VGRKIHSVYFLSHSVGRKIHSVDACLLKFLNYSL
jgi:hypothetical protein